MESNSDKAMRDKLQGVEMPFDPAAWEQMEAMLNKDEKKRGFFWWWFGAGMTALLLLSGAGAYVAMHSSTQGEQLAVNGKRTKVKTESATGSTSINSTQPSEASNASVVNGKQANVIGNEEEANLSSTSNANNTDNGQPTTHNTSTSKAKSAKPASTRNPQPATRNSNSTGNSQQSTKNASATRKAKNAKPSSIRNQQLATSNPALLTDFNGKPIANTANTGTAANLSTQAEAVSADKYWMTYLTPTPAENTMLPNESNTDLPKVKAKMFQYSAGLLVHAGSTIVGPSRFVSDTANTNINLGSSFRIGFTHDFLFAKRFAISNSILYSQSSFTVGNVRSESFRTPPISFTTQIKELAIPIGIKVYPVSKPKIRFYLSAGIVNHIKLSETFSYATWVAPKQDTTPSPIPTITNNYPTATNFDGTATGSVETYENNYTLAGNTVTTTVVGVNSSEFSINNAKRYYASFYAGAGVEGIIKNKWVLFAEPTFSMDLHKIGIQQRRKYSVGGNLGFRYQF